MAEEIGKQIQSTFDNLSYAQCSIKRSGIVKPLSVLYETNTNKSVFTDISTSHYSMFNRLVAVSERIVSLETAFKYELTSHPTSLFNDKKMMRKPSKSSLMKTLVKADSEITSDEMEIYSQSVIDGGALLHRVQWAKGLDKKRKKLEKMIRKTTKSY